MSSQNSLLTAVQPFILGGTSGNYLKFGVGILSYIRKHSHYDYPTD